jgi:predicted ATPase
VEGESFTAEVLARVQGLDESLVIQQLSGPLSVRHHLVAADSVRRLDGRKLCRYRFRHGLFQHYLYQSVDAVERIRLHEAVGRALEALCGPEAGAISTALARHFEAAGMTPKAVDCLLQAGLEAARLSAHEEAVALFRRGLELLEAEPPTPDRDRRELALRSALRGPLRATRGSACPELARSEARARALRSRLGESPTV